MSRRVPLVNIEIHIRVRLWTSYCLPNDHEEVIQHVRHLRGSTKTSGVASTYD